MFKEKKGLPRARKEMLLIQAVGDELVVYDQERHRAHTLNATAAFVWRNCNGQNTVDDIAELLEKQLNIGSNEACDVEGLVWLTLRELENCSLLEESLPKSAGQANASRREMMKRRLAC